MSESTPKPLLAFMPYLVVSVLQLVSRFFSIELLYLITKPLLMPLLVLVLFFLTKKRDAIFGLAVAGLSASCLGDIALMVPGSTFFIIGLSCFLLAHIFYLALFIKRTVIQKWHTLAALYPMWFFALIYILYPYLGGMLVPVILYGLVLTAMGVFSSRGNFALLMGGLFFVISDSLLAAGRFLPAEVVEIPYSSVLVMFSYCLAQGLIAYGIYYHRQVFPRQ